MESENRINELRRLGEASGGDPNLIMESEYWAGFRSAWESGCAEGLKAGRDRAMADLNIHLNPR
jgi:hypothetical protein